MGLADKVRIKFRLEEGKTANILVCRKQALGRCCSQNKGYMAIQGLMWLEESLVANTATPSIHMSLVFLYR